MTFIFAFLGRLGVPEPLRKLVAIGGAIVLLLLCAGLWLTIHDRGVVKQHEAEREVAAAQHREEAAAERVNDAILNARTEEDLHNAIDNAPKGTQLSAPALALACERLRKLGRVSPACGPTSGDGK